MLTNRVTNAARNRDFWRSLTITGVCAAMLAITAAVHAQPTAFTYQGQLKDGGVPANGTYDLGFSLWDQPDGGNLVAGPLLQPGSAVTAGLFTSELDYGPVFTGAPMWLEISVNGTALSPRQALNSTPYCQMSSTAQSATTADYAYGPWVPAGSNLYYLDGNVGIGTSAPTAKLEIAGTPGVDGIKFPDGTTQVSAATGGTGFWTANGADIYSNNAGNVGIGRTNPSYKLDSNSSTGLGARIGMQDAGGGALVVGCNPGDNRVYLEGFNSTNNGHATEMLITGFAGGTLPQLTLNVAKTIAQGSVGIGTSTPAYPLTIKTGAGFAGYGWVHTDGTRELGSYVNSTGGWLGTRSNHPLYLFTNDSAPRVTLSTDGALGVGTSSPSAFAQLAVFGGATNRAGYFESDRGGLTGWSNSSGFTGITGGNGQGGGVGVYSVGNFVATGTKSFQIDHPLDPENKYLTHYCAEGPEPLNVYRGNVTLDAAGQAWVTLPDYFAEINRDPSYQLTPIGDFAPVFVKQKIADNRFLVAGGKPGMEVSWRVEAVRNDRFVRTYGAAVETEKPADKRGTYLQPALYGQPVEKGQFYQARPTEAPVSREPAGSSN